MLSGIKRSVTYCKYSGYSTPPSISFCKSCSAFSSRVPSRNVTLRVFSTGRISVTMVGEPLMPTASASTPRSSSPHWVMTFFLALIMPEKLSALGAFKSRVTVSNAGSLIRIRRYPFSSARFHFP